MLFQLLVVCIIKNLHKEQNLFKRRSGAHLLSPLSLKNGDFQKWSLKHKLVFPYKFEN
jgi:hypothetical protein